MTGGPAYLWTLKPEANLSIIQQHFKEREDENYYFRSFLEQKDEAYIDHIVHRLNDQIAPQIDCTQCGNCCRTYMISLEKKDADRLSAHLGISTNELSEKYLETSQEETVQVFNKIPCHFLQDNKCTVYEARPGDCRDFPHLHKKGFTSRLFSMISFYGTCPIVYNVMEQLKRETGFFKK